MRDWPIRPIADDRATTDVEGFALATRRREKRPQRPAPTLPLRPPQGADGSGCVSEIIFVVEDAPEGGFTARALGASIFTEADDLTMLHVNVRDAVHCHFEPDELPKVIRLHFVREEVIAV